MSIFVLSCMFFEMLMFLQGSQRAVNKLKLYAFDVTMIHDMIVP